MDGARRPNYRGSRQAIKAKMKKLLTFLIKNITGSKDFSVEEAVNDSSHALTIKADPGITGMIIGKQGKTIKNVRRILSTKAALEKTYVSVNLADEGEESRS